MHGIGTKHIVRHRQKSVVQWSVISKFACIHTHIQVNLDMTDSMGLEKFVRHMQNPSYTYDEYLICIGLGPSISSVICKNPSYSGPSYPSSPVYIYMYIYKMLYSKMFIFQLTANRLRMFAPAPTPKPIALLILQNV